MKFGYHTVTWGLNAISRFFPRTLGEMSAAGFKAFETHDVNVLPFMENTNGFVDILNEHDMHLIAVYCPGQFIPKSFIDGLILKYYLKEAERFTKFAEFVASVGGEKLTVGGTVGLKATNDKDFEILSNLLNEVGKNCRNLGLKFSYHPHLKTMIETKDEFGKLCELTDPDLVNLTLETGHMHISKTDLIDLIETYGDRINHVHFKDVRDEKFVEFGTGIIDFVPLLHALQKIHYADWIVIEDELNSPEILWAGKTDRSPAEIAKNSYQHLQSLKQRL